MRPPAIQLLGLVGVSIFAFGVGSCADPVHDRQVEDLGSEVGDLNEYHRAGQPCLTCHGSLGPATTRFSIAGTVFAAPWTSAATTAVGVADVEIELVDATGATPPLGTVKTNCVGNFFVKREEWDPAFPALVWIRKGAGSAGLKKMQSHIGREPSCNQCHRDPASFDSPGHIFMYDAEPNTLPPAGCPVDPVVPLRGGP